VKKSSYILYIIIFSALLLIAFLFIHLVNIQKQNVRLSLEIEGGKAAGFISSNFDQTAAIIANMNLQIAQNPYSNSHIFNILRRYKTHPSLTNSFAWTIFSWVDIDNNLTVDAVYGVMKKPIYVFRPQYLELTRQDPWKFYLGAPIIGPTSNKKIISAGAGVEDSKGNYVGATVIGLKIDALAKIVQKNITNSNITVKMIDTNWDWPIFASSLSEVKLFNIEKEKLDQNDKELLDVVKPLDNTFYDVSVLGNQRGHYVKKIDGYNYAILLEYDEKAIISEFWTSVISRSVDIGAILLIAGILIFLIYKREKSQKKLLLKLNKDSKDKTNLLKTTSHDLRTYISGISGLSSIIADSKNGDDNEGKNQEFAEMISAQSREMLEFIEELLEESSAESDRLKMGNLEGCDIVSLLKETQILIDSFAQDHKVKIEVNILQKVPKILCDKRRLRQILNNLLINAIKYSSKGGKVEVTLQYLKPKNKIYLEISDNGIGMSDRDLEKALSGEGSKIDKSKLNKKIDSHGVGLPLVQKLIDIHGAKMEIESSKGIGTKVKLWFAVVD